MDKFIIFLDKLFSSLQGIEANSKLLLKDNKVSFYSNEIICKFGKSNHFLWKCSKFQNLSLDQRKKIIFTIIYAKTVLKLIIWLTIVRVLGVCKLINYFSKCMLMHSNININLINFII